MGPRTAEKVNYHISKTLEDFEEGAAFSDEEEKRENSDEANSPKKNGAKTRNVINKVGTGAIGILGGALGISGTIANGQHDQQEELYRKRLKTLEDQLRQEEEINTKLESQIAEKEEENNRQHEDNKAMWNTRADLYKEI